MLDINLIENTITELENSDTNFSTCDKLASLYIIKQYYKPISKSVETCVDDELKKELADIIPHYQKYCGLKKRYQLKEIDKEPMIDSFKAVMKEITDFLHIIYNNTDTPEERDIMRIILEDIQL